MQLRLLIDGIVRQTTLPMAQLSTTSGSRSPLSRIADQVFVNLAQELESQGVSKPVAADMFGLALRSFQKKVQRPGASVSEPNRTFP